MSGCKCKDPLMRLSRVQAGEGTCHHCGETVTTHHIALKAIAASHRLTLKAIATEFDDKLKDVAAAFDTKLREIREQRK